MIMFILCSPLAHLFFHRLLQSIKCVWMDILQIKSSRSPILEKIPQIQKPETTTWRRHDIKVVVERRSVPACPILHHAPGWVMRMIIAMIYSEKNAPRPPGTWFHVATPEDD